MRTYKFEIIINEKDEPTNKEFWDSLNTTEDEVQGIKNLIDTIKLALIDYGFNNIQVNCKKFKDQ